MTRRQSQRSALRATAAAVALLSMMMTAPAEARGGHGLHRASPAHHAHHGRDEGSFASDRRHANDTYVNAATQEEDKLLNTQIKSICRGC
jgi:hypothetical protein